MRFASQQVTGSADVERCRRYALDHRSALHTPMFDRRTLTKANWARRQARPNGQGEIAMKAVRLLEYGGQLVFNDVPTPTIARDEVLVKIKKYRGQSCGSC